MLNELGLKIKEMCNECKISIGFLEKSLGVPRTYVNHIMHGRRLAKEEVLEAIEDFFYSRTGKLCTGLIQVAKLTEKFEPLKKKLDLKNLDTSHFMLVKKLSSLILSDDDKAYISEALTKISKSDENIGKHFILMRDRKMFVD